MTGEAREPVLAEIWIQKWKADPVLRARYQSDFLAFVDDYERVLAGEAPEWVLPEAVE